MYVINFIFHKYQFYDTFFIETTKLIYCILVASCFVFPFLISFLSISLMMHIFNGIIFNYHVPVIQADCFLCEKDSQIYFPQSQVES